ncbi:MAG TPA: hypothetical protein VHE81_19640 [Lacipirellulaceae bacterium]|nr:hypothetical protein [Lacipirellulaceae bacterium]
MSRKNANGSSQSTSLSNVTIPNKRPSAEVSTPSYDNADLPLHSLVSGKNGGSKSNHAAMGPPAGPKRKLVKFDDFPSSKLKENERELVTISPILHPNSSRDSSSAFGKYFVVPRKQQPTWSAVFFERVAAAIP